MKPRLLARATTFSITCSFGTVKFGRAPSAGSAGYFPINGEEQPPQSPGSAGYFPINGEEQPPQSPGSAGYFPINGEDQLPPTSPSRSHRVQKCEALQAAVQVVFELGVQDSFQGRHQVVV